MYLCEECTAQFSAARLECTVCGSPSVRVIPDECCGAYDRDVCKCIPPPEEP